MTKQDPRYAKRRAVLIDRGQWQPWADAAPVREHVRTLMAAGVGRSQIAARAQVPDRTVCRLLYEGQQKIRPAAAEKIMRVTGSEQPIGACLAAATGTMRRLQALAVLGWSPRLLAAELGMHTSAVRLVRDGERARIRSATAEAVTALYAKLWDRPPPEATGPERIAATKTRDHARHREWVPPMAWDDDTIDDPAGRPAGALKY
jgi:hypothetical protein